MLVFTINGSYLLSIFLEDSLFISFPGMLFLPILMIFNNKGEFEGLLDIGLAMIEISNWLVLNIATCSVLVIRFI